jgi:DNA-binding MarR family transcriptional regulator
MAEFVKNISVYGVDMKVEISEDAFYAARLLKKRTQYIYEMHNKMRDWMTLLFAIYAGNNIGSAFSKAGGVKAALILCYVDKFEYIDKRQIERYFMEAKRFNNTKQSVYNYLEKEGYLYKVMDYPNPILYSITTKGRDYYKQACKIFVREISDFMAGRVPKTMRPPRNRETTGDSLIKSQAGENRKQKARENYIMMMQPFWDEGLKRLPKNLKYRYDILYNYIMRKKDEGQEINTFLYKLLEKWQPDENYQFFSSLSKGMKKKRKKEAPIKKHGAKDVVVDNDVLSKL